MVALPTSITSGQSGHIDWHEAIHAGFDGDSANIVSWRVYATLSVRPAASSVPTGTAAFVTSNARSYRSNGTSWIPFDNSVINALDYMVGDSTGPGNGTDDTSGFQSAVTAAIASNKVCYVPATANGYRLTGSVSASSPVTIASNGAKIVVDIPSASGSTPLFQVTSSDVELFGLHFDGTGKTGTPTGSRQCVLVDGAVGAELRRVWVRNCRFTELDTGFFAGTKPNTTQVCHGVYMDYAKDSGVEGCFFDQLSGAATFFQNCTSIKVCKNNAYDCLWYPFHFEGNNLHVEVSHNTYVGVDAHSSNYGAPIDIMSQVTGDGAGANIDFDVHDNYISGVVAYGASGAIRCTSAQDVKIHDNTFDQIANSIVIRVGHRQVTALPTGATPENIKVYDNFAKAKGTNQIFVYATGGESGTGHTGTPGLARDLEVKNNRVDSVDASNYFASLATVHGQDYGWDGVEIVGNVGRGNPISSGSNQGGFIAVLATATGAPTTKGRIESNRLTFFDGAGGVGANTQDAAIHLSQYSRKFHVADNTTDGFYYGIRCSTNAGPDITGIFGGTNRHYNAQNSEVLVASGVTCETVPTVASTGTMTIPNHSEVVIVSGTTNIATVTANGRAGQRVTLVFQDVLSVSEAGNLRLAGAFSTTADDTLTLACDGTNWFEVCRSVN